MNNPFIHAQSAAILIIAAILSLSFQDSAAAQVQSFEDRTVPENYSIDKGRLSISSEKYKLGSSSLKIDWKGGAAVIADRPEGISEASASRNGGLSTWIYNTVPVRDSLVFSFLDKDGKELCRLPFCMDFTGWRCIWAKFQADMGMEKGREICSAVLHFPTGIKKGTSYIDILEFPETVSWQNMSDAQYKVNRTDFSLISDFLGYRNAEKAVSDTIRAGKEQISIIADRLERWYLGSGMDPGDGLVRLRAENEKKFIAAGVKKASRYTAGTPLFPWGAPDRIGSEKCVKFRELNEFVLIPLALDWRKNGNRESLDKAIRIYDWFHDQGWADGSGMGTLTFEKLRSCGYFHSFFLLKDELGKERLERELNTIDWFSLFGMCFTEPASKGEVADNLRALAIPKLIYALSLTDTTEQQVALTAYKKHMDNALGIAPGYFGTFKADFSGYHHRGPYHSAYYPHALYAGSLIAYLLHGTPYALSDETLQNLKNGLLNFRFFCAGLDVPAGTSGRFPEGREVLQEILPAFAYAACSFDKPDPELTAALKKILSTGKYRKAIEDYAANVKSSLAYTSTVGEMELMESLAGSSAEAEDEPSGAKFYPYSGLLVSKDRETQFNIKGFSRYIWDFESSATENIYGRYVSYGHIEYSDFRNGGRSFNPEQEQWDWNYIPGTTSKVLPYDMLQGKGGADSGHRNFSDEAFLAGVAVSDSLAMFSVRLHDTAYDSTFRADKSVFLFKDWIFCLGSGISCRDSAHHVVTTLFQSFDGVSAGNGTAGSLTDVGSFAVGRTADGYIAEDASFIYAVKDGDVKTTTKDGCSRAFIDHGTAPQDGHYGYFILKDKEMAKASQLISSGSPIEIIETGHDAHIIREKETGAVCAAIFNEEKTFAHLPVNSVNIPLAYIFSDGRLTVCEPDMRRPCRAHMGLLTDEDVIAEEKPHETVIRLNGHFAVSGDTEDFSSDYDPSTGLTTVRFTTIRARNYSFSVIPCE